MRFVPYPKIKQFRNVVQDIWHLERYLGTDADGTRHYDKDKEMPTITFRGTVKLHGTNAAICSQGSDIWFQSRENILSPLKDNAGFACYFSASDRQEAIRQLTSEIRDKNNLDSDTIIVLFGEWAGKGVQKNVAISQLDKRFYLFGLLATNDVQDDDGNYIYNMWLPIEGIRNHDVGIYNITDYQTYELRVDLNQSKDAIPLIQNIVDAVEAECPVAKAFGVSGVGEGVVWSGKHRNSTYVFKTKGKEHAVTVHKDQKAATTDVEKVNTIAEFVAYAVTPARLEQGIEKVFTAQGVTPSVEKTGDFLRWLLADIVSEEIDTISKNGLSVRDINSAVANAGRTWFFTYLDSSTTEAPKRKSIPLIPLSDEEQMLRRPLPPEILASAIQSPIKVQDVWGRSETPEKSA